MEAPTFASDAVTESGDGDIIYHSARHIGLTCSRYGKDNDDVLKSIR